MKKTLISMLAATVLAGGCASSSDHKPAGASVSQRLPVTEIAPLPPVISPQQQPLQSQPVEAVSYSSAATPAAAIASGTYTVKRGDTLFKIAREHYGDGKQWQKIASANPGLTPATLKAGQKISLPQ